MKVHLPVSAVVAVATIGCQTAEDRYRWNVNHAQVTPWTHLTQSDRDAIIHLVSAREAKPIIGISQHPPDEKHGDTISVYTGEANSDVDIWRSCDLRKEANGSWRIVDEGPISHTVAGMDLGGMFHQAEEQRRK